MLFKKMLALKVDCYNIIFIFNDIFLLVNMRILHEKYVILALKKKNSIYKLKKYYI